MIFRVDKQETAVNARSNILHRAYARLLILGCVGVGVGVVVVGVVLACLSRFGAHEDTRKSSRSFCISFAFVGRSNFADKRSMNWIEKVDKWYLDFSR